MSERYMNTFGVVFLLSVALLLGDRQFSKYLAALCLSFAQLVLEKAILYLRYLKKLLTRKAKKKIF